MVETTKQITANTGSQNDIWHKPFNLHPNCKANNETPAQIRERSLKAREIGKNLTKNYASGRTRNP